MHKSSHLTAHEAEAAVKTLLCLQTVVTTDNPAARGQKGLQKTTWTCVSRGGAGAVPGGDRRTPGTNIPVPAHGTAFTPATPQPAPALLGGAHHQAKRGQMLFPAQHSDLGNNSDSVYTVL